MKLNVRLVCGVVACVTVVAAPVVVVIGDRKARKKINDIQLNRISEKIEDDEPIEVEEVKLSTKEQVKETWVYYTPGIALAAAGIAATIVGSRSATKQITALAGAGAAAATAYSRFKNVVYQNLPEEEFEKLEKLEKQPLHDPVVADNNPTWHEEIHWIDLDSTDEIGQTVEWDATEETVYKAQMEVNRLLYLDGDVSMYDFLCMAGHPNPPEQLKEHGWDKSILTQPFKGGEKVTYQNLPWIDFSVYWDSEKQIASLRYETMPWMNLYSVDSAGNTINTTRRIRQRH